jgi:integrase
MTRLGRAPGAGTLRKVQRGGTPAQWVLEWTDANGDRHREALSTDRRVAERLRVQIIGRRDLDAAGLGAVEGQSMLLATLRDMYIADLETRVGAAQQRRVKGALAGVLAKITAARVRDVRVIDVLRYRSERVRDGASHRTVNIDTGTLKAMFTWAVGAQLIAENPLQSFRPLPAGERYARHVRRALSDEEIERFLAAADADDQACASRVAAERTIKSRPAEYAERPRATRVPQRPLWQTLLETGARWGELTNTRWADLDADQRCITLRATTTKSGKSRTIPLRQELLDELVALRAVHQRSRRRVVQPTDRVFVTPDGADHDAATTGMRRLFRRVLDRAGIDRTDVQGRHIDIHALRHTAASRFARRGVPLVHAQHLLGHSDPKLTARVYTHLGVDDLREAVEGAPKPRIVRGASGKLEESA